MKDDFIELKVAFAMVLGVLSLIAIIGIVINYHDTTTWNEGYHTLDNGKWEYLQMIGRGYHDIHYVYKCSECGKIVELSEYYQEVEE